jgi:hypothetical protein
MTSKALKNSLYWQRQVYSQSRDPVQKERCAKAIEKLKAQIEETKKNETHPS